MSFCQIFLEIPLLLIPASSRGMNFSNFRIFLAVPTEGEQLLAYLKQARLEEALVDTR